MEPVEQSESAQTGAAALALALALALAGLPTFKPHSVPSAPDHFFVSSPTLHRSHQLLSRHHHQITTLTTLAAHSLTDCHSIERDATRSAHRSILPKPLAISQLPQLTSTTTNWRKLTRSLRRRAPRLWRRCYRYQLVSSMSSSFSGPRLPLSPASPPDSGLKHDLVIQPTAVTPQTPPSPALSGMSVATKRYVSSYENNRHTDELADRSTSDMYSRPHPNPTPSASQTPNALKRPLSQDDEERPVGKRQKKAADEPGSDIELDDSFAATNHDRQPGSNGAVNLDLSDKAVSQEENVMPGIKQAILEPTEKAFLVGNSSKARPPHSPFVCFLN